MISATPFLSRVLVVVLLAVEEDDDVGVLLDGAGLAQVGEARDGGSRFSTSRFSCESAITGTCSSLASAFSEREISEISCSRLSLALGAAH